MRRTSGVSMKPDSSRKTRLAPRFTAFFLDAGTPLCANARWQLRLSPGLAAKAAVPSIPIGRRGSCGHGPRDRRSRIAARSIPSRAGRSTGRWPIRGLWPLWSKMTRVFGALPRSTAAFDRDGVCSKAQPRSKPVSPNGSRSLGWRRRYSPLLFGCVPPLTIRSLAVVVSPVPLHSLLASWRGSVT